MPIEVSRLRLGLHDALHEAEASRSRLAEASAVERKRLERDLHDGVQQRIVATGMRLRLLESRIDDAAATEIKTAVSELEATVSELRSLAHGVRPSRLDDGLGAALEAVRDASPIPLDLEVGDLPALDHTRALTAYLVASEGVANALKHVRASRISIRVACDGGNLSVVVCDDGIGGVSPKGLIGLGDRVAAVGGHLRVVSSPGAGTEIQAVI